MYVSARAMTAPPTTNFALMTVALIVAGSAVPGSSGWAGARRGPPRAGARAPPAHALDGGAAASSRRGRAPRARRRRGRTTSCRASGEDLLLLPQQAHTLGREVAIEEHEGDEVDHEGENERWVHRRAAGPQQRGRLVERPPPEDRKVDERDVERGDDAEHRGEPGRPLAILDHRA